MRPALAWITVLALAGPVVPASRRAVVVRPQREGPVDLRVGDPAIDGSFVKPFTARYRITVTAATGETQDWGTEVHEVQVVTMQGRPVLKRIRFMSGPRKTVCGIAFADRATFAPILSQEIHSDGSYWRYEFAGKRVRMQRSAEPAMGELRETELELDVPVFDFNLGPYELMFAGLPLRQGYSARIPAFILDNAGPPWAGFEVTGREPTPIETSRSVDAWIVETQYNAEWKQVLWLAREPPYLLRFSFRGPRGGRQDWRLDVPAPQPR